jgi:hypothetical protein
MLIAPLWILLVLLLCGFAVWLVAMFWFVIRREKRNANV